MIFLNQSLILNNEIDNNAPFFGINNLVLPTNLSVNGGGQPGHPITNIANPSTNLRWRQQVSGSININVLNLSGLINYVGIACHNLGSTESSIRVFGNGGSGLIPLTGTIFPGNDEPIILVFDRFAYTSILLQLSNSDGLREIAVVNVGDGLASQRNIYVGHRPITLNSKLDVVNGRSEAGDYLGRIVVGERRQTSIELTELTPLWVRGNLMPFLNEAKTKPFFFAWRPFSYPDEAGYVWLTDDPAVTNTRGNGFMGASMSVAGII